MELKKQISGGSISDQVPPLFTSYPWLVIHNLEEEDEEQAKGKNADSEKEKEAERKNKDSEEEKQAEGKNEDSEKEEEADREIEDSELQSFYIVNHHLSRFQCRIPELIGRRIRGCFHGWLILYNHPRNVMIWSLWNPVTSKLIRLPPLILKDGGDFDDVRDCCLSSPPGDPSSILLLMRKKKPTIIFCRLDLKRKRSKWVEMSYAKQLERLTHHDDLICSPAACSNGKVYATSLHTFNVIQIDIHVVKDREVVISLLPFVELPVPFLHTRCNIYWLKGSTQELFCILLGFDEVASNTPAAVHLFKLDMTSAAPPTWEEIKDLQDAIFFVDLTQGEYTVFYHPAIASGLGGYVHFRGEYGNRINSYHVKDKTVSLTPMPCLNQKRYVSLWECRLEGNHEEAKCRVDYIQKEDNQEEVEMKIVTDEEVKFNDTTNESSHLFRIPSHVLELIMEFCVGVEYMKFRATCKLCHVAAPLVRCRNESTLRRVQRYSFDTPLLMVLEENQRILNFTDPIFGDKYLIKTLPGSISYHDKKLICCSRYGWLLFYTNLSHLVFFNPFTRDVRNLPTTPHLLENLCFSAPPTSQADCKVVGFTTRGGGHAYILHFKDQDSLWRRVDMDYGGADPFAFRFPTFYGQDLYALCNEGKLVVFKEMNEESFSWEVVVTEAPKCSWRRDTLYYLVKCDQQLLLFTMGEYGEFVEVFELNDSTKEWKKVDCLGKHSIYISDTTCLSVESKTPKMWNKIYLPRLSSKNGKIVFYSLETGLYHTFIGELMEQTSWGNLIFGTKHHLHPHAWIEPSWCLFHDYACL